MSRCIYCGRRIWPWQRGGREVLRRGWDDERAAVVRWHGKCYRVAL